MLLMTSNHPQRRRQSRPRVLCAPRSGRSALTDAGAKGTPATDARPCIFNTFTHSNRRVYLEQRKNAGFFA